MHYQPEHHGHEGGSVQAAQGHLKEGLRRRAVPTAALTSALARPQFRPDPPCIASRNEARDPEHDAAVKAAAPLHVNQAERAQNVGELSFLRPSGGPRRTSRVRFSTPEPAAVIEAACQGDVCGANSSYAGTSGEANALLLHPARVMDWCSHLTCKYAEDIGSPSCCLNCSIVQSSRVRVGQIHNSCVACMNGRQCLQQVPRLTHLLGAACNT